MKSVNKFQFLANHRLQMKLFMLWKLPLAFMARLRIEQMNMEKASVSLPYNYLIKTHFDPYILQL